MTTATTTTDAPTATTEGDTRSNVLPFPTTRKPAYPNPVVKVADLPANAIRLYDERLARQPRMTPELAAGLAYVAVRDLKEEVAALRNQVAALQQGEG